MTHTSARHSWALTGKSGLVFYRVTALFFWALMHTSFVVHAKSLFFWEFSVLSMNPKVGKSAVEPRTFARV